MVTKHFFKILFLFTLMIILGMAGVLFIGYFDKGEASKILNKAGIAK